MEIGLDYLSKTEDHIISTVPGVKFTFIFYLLPGKGVFELFFFIASSENLIDKYNLKYIETFSKVIVFFFCKIIDLSLSISWPRFDMHFSLKVSVSNILNMNPWNHKEESY